MKPKTLFGIFLLTGLILISTGFAATHARLQPAQATWTTQANQLGGRVGQRFTLVCPGGGTISGRLWGTGVYTDDSSICTAAVHAGLISTARGGVVTLEMRAGASSYTASTRYGVTSLSYGAWSGSFVFLGGEEGGGRDGGNQSQATWTTQANQLGGRVGQRFTVACPGGGTLSSRLWGTDVYTDDSSICTAAVHAGLISVGNGGTVTIELRAGTSAYNASSRYGVNSQSYGAWSGSFAFVGGGPSDGGTQTQATWATQANQLGGRVGQRFTLACPGGGTLSSRLWGTDLYTDDSSICTAAVHAGLISVARGGTVTIELRPGASVYNASNRYGVASQRYGAWSGSFVFVGGGPTEGRGGICDDPRTQASMDEWLAGANPLENQRPGWRVRYEPWGRLVGSSPTANINAPSPPDTRLTRCEYLWSIAASLRSTNLGTLKEYVEQRRR